MPLPFFESLFPSVCIISPFFYFMIFILVFNQFNDRYSLKRRYTRTIKMDAIPHNNASHAGMCNMFVFL